MPNILECCVTGCTKSIAGHSYYYDTVAMFCDDHGAYDNPPVDVLTLRCVRCDAIHRYTRPEFHNEGGFKCYQCHRNRFFGTVDFIPIDIQEYKEEYARQQYLGKVFSL